MKPADRDLAIPIRHYVTGSLLPMPRATSLRRHCKRREKIQIYPIFSRLFKFGSGWHRMAQDGVVV
jgi:hypothetical protein